MGKLEPVGRIRQIGNEKRYGALVGEVEVTIKYLSEVARIGREYNRITTQPITLSNRQK